MSDYQTKTQLVPKLSLQVSVRELHNGLVSDPNNDFIKDARNGYDNIIISDSTLRLLLPPQLEKCPHEIRSCVVVTVAFLPKVCIHHFCPGVTGI